jgi:hypothetical protein
MTPLQILKIGRARISHPSAWSQGKMIREDGSRCALGSLLHEDKFEEIHYDAARYLARALGFIGPTHECGSIVAAYNDNHTHAQVLAMFDRAIELAEYHEEAEIAAEIDTISVDELIEVLSPA